MKSLVRIGFAAAAIGAAVFGAVADQPVSGAIFTTYGDGSGAAVNVNIYNAKDDVYLNGGPAHPGAAGLPDGEYYVQVTEPNGTVLGTSLGSIDETPVIVSGGEFYQLYQLSSILLRASDSTQGYDDTTNNGGEYKVWVSNDRSFANNSSKTDNFKVKPRDNGGDDEPDPIVHVMKFYDANANGAWDSGEAAVDGWKVDVAGANGYTDVVYTTWTATVDAGDWTFTEATPVETNWLHTSALSVSLTLANGDEKDVTFGNLCLGAGGGLTLGFWSNKNGQKLIGGDDLSMLRGCNLVGASGSAFDPTSAGAVKTWLLNGNAVNMSYMLSVQLSAMELNVLNGGVSGSSLVYAPGLGTSGHADVDGDGTPDFLSVSDLMAAADAELATHTTAFDGDAWRSYQEALKNALDAGNNNRNFVQSSASSFSF